MISLEHSSLGCLCPQPHLYSSFSLICTTARTVSGKGNGTPLQYSCLENPMDGGAWKAAVHGVAEGWTRLSDFTFTLHFHALEKEMATHFSVLAWRIQGTEELWWAAVYEITQSWTRLKRLSSSSSNSSKNCLHSASRTFPEFQQVGSNRC